MLQISKIVEKTEEMFDLFNKHFYNNELTRQQLPYLRTVDEEPMAGAASMKSGTLTAKATGKSIFAPSI